MIEISNALKELEEAKTLADRLRGTLSLRGANPNRIETHTGIKRQTLYFVLNGKTKEMQWSTLEALAEYLGVRVEWLAKGVAPMYPSPSLEDWEIQLIHDVRAMSESHRRDLKQIASQWAMEDSPKPSMSRPFNRKP